MNTIRINASCRPLTQLARAAAIVAGLYLALVVGTPWLLYDAPPSAQDVLASSVYCVPASTPSAAR